MSSQGWRRCSACKKPIDFGVLYWVCSVSTCNRKRTGLVFCSVSCWEVHLPVARHREAWAEERTAPSEAQARASAAASSAPGPKREPRRIIPAQPVQRAVANETDDVPQEILIVASRLKAYIQASAGFNVSDRVLGPLSTIVRKVCDEAIRNARRDERKTVLERDIPSDRR